MMQEQQQKYWNQMFVKYHKSFETGKKQTSLSLAVSLGYQGVAFAWPVWEHSRGRFSGAWELIGWRVGGVGVIALPFFFPGTCLNLLLHVFSVPSSEALPFNALSGQSTGTEMPQMNDWHPWSYGRGFLEARFPLSRFAWMRWGRRFESDLADVLHLRRLEKPMKKELWVVQLSVSLTRGGDKTGPIACTTIFPVGSNFLCVLTFEVVAWGYRFELKEYLASVVPRSHRSWWVTNTGCKH